MTVPPSKQTTEEQGAFHPAAVLLPFCDQGGELHLVFTKRSHSVQHHKGQICFPGGSREQGDENLWQTALRETHEEIGVAPSRVYYVGELERVKTPTLFEVTPFVGLIVDRVEFMANPDEIDSILLIPVDHLRDRRSLRFEDLEYFGKKHKTPFFTYRGTEIWGVTGRILLNVLALWG